MNVHNHICLVCLKILWLGFTNKGSIHLYNLVSNSPPSYVHYFSLVRFAYIFKMCNLFDQCIDILEN